LRIWKTIAGYVMIRVEGLSLERFLNLAAEAGITVYDVWRVSYTVLRAALGAGGYRRLKGVIPEKYAVTVEKKAGLPFAIQWLFTRKALLLGLGVLAAAILAASMFVWDVRVKGIERREAIQLEKELGSLGVYAGAYKGNIDLKRIETRLLVRHDELAWVNLKITGAVAELEVVPAVMPPELVDDTRPCSIVADKDALIESVQALNGRAAVVKGQTVRKGDVLISGLILDEGLTELRVAARGRVVGSVWYRAEAGAPTTKETRTPTGRTQVQRVMTIGADTAALDAPCSFAEYDTRVLKTDCVGGLFLPVKVVTLEHTEVTVEQTPVSKETLRATLEERAFFEAERLVPDDADVVGHETVFEEKDGVLKATVYVQTHEDIGKVVYLEE